MADLFTAAIPMAGSYSIDKDLQIPTYAIHSAEDELFSLEKNQISINTMKSRDVDLTFVVADSLTHFEACNYVQYLDAAGIWLEEEIWR